MKQKSKYKKFRKAHIWPSILFLILSFIMALTSAVFSSTLAAGRLVTERLKYICGIAVSLTDSLEAVEGSESEILKNIEKKGDLSEAVFVFGRDGNIIASYGEQTSEADEIPNIPEFFYPEKNLSIYLDKYSSAGLFDEYGNIKPRSLFNESNIKIEKGDKVSFDTAVYGIDFWVKSEMDDGRSVIIKSCVMLYLQDMIFLIAPGVIAYTMMGLPLLFLFINVITNVVNHRRMLKLLYTDMLTQGNNWIYFEQNTEKTLRKRRSIGKTFAFVDITVVKFRTYCNCHGVEAGDKLLMKINRSLENCMNRSEICAHSGKSSFAVFMQCGDKDSCEKRVQTILDDLSADMENCGISFHAGIFFITPEKGLEPDAADFFNRASAARAVLTDENVNAVAVYNDKLLEEQLWEHKVEEKMQAALDNEEFKVYIQPKYDPVTEKLTGAEALVRWINEEDGFISPGKFIPIFEKNGFITKLDDYMLSHVSKLQAEWLAQGKTVVPISVNVSRAHFASSDLAQHICTLVDEYKVPHKYIEIELTESAFFDDKAALLRTVHQLRDLGFEISMDDFGAGYSSLNSLKDLPLDVLKLDADFFRGEDSENRGEIVVSQAIHLAKSLNMRIVAEGVEKKEQVDFLAGQGCDMIQGFYFAKPMPANEYEQRLDGPRGEDTGSAPESGNAPENTDE